VEGWFMQLISKALERVCADSVRTNVLWTFHDGNLTLRKLISKMSNNEACKETAQKLADGNFFPGTKGFDKLLNKTEAGVACMDYLTSLDELKELINNAT